MEATNIPPLINSAAPEAEPGVARWRWWIHLVVLAAFPLLVGLLTYQGSTAGGEPALPATVHGLLIISSRELLFFSALLALAWIASRAKPRQLMLTWRGGARPVLWGFAYSVALRITVMILAVILVMLWFLVKGAKVSDLQQVRPHIEQVVDVNALTGNPLYFALMLTLISFVVAGLREELWRSGMLAAMNVLFPRQFATIGGKVAAVALTAVIFGLGHAIQGWSGVLATALLGAGLGAIMLRHRSIWEAVLAHGFFDASTFVFLYVVVKFQPELLRAI